MIFGEARPVSAALEAALREAVDRSGLVLWLDPEARWTGLADALIAERAAGRLSYDVVALRGSHLALMLALDPLLSRPDRPRLAIHLPGLDARAVRRTPLLALCAAGAVHEPDPGAATAAAAAGRIPAEALAAFLSRGLPLDEADAGLAELLAATRSRATAPLDGPSAAGVLDALILEEPSARLADEVERLRERLCAWTGAARLAGETPGELAASVAGFAMAAECAVRLAPTPAEGLLGEAAAIGATEAAACRALAEHLREHHPALYRRVADEIGDEVAAALGATALPAGGGTFRFEEARTLAAALAGDARSALSLSEARAGGETFWTRDDPALRASWLLVRAAAVLRVAIEDAKRQREPADHAEALARYEAEGSAIDRAHRELEQRREALLGRELPQAAALAEHLDAARAAWRRWADAAARAFDGLCRDRGFLPPPPLQQRTLLDAVVRPLTREEGTTVLIVVDAMRHEAAAALGEALQGPTVAVSLRARLAELPTADDLGLDAIAVSPDRGRLRPHVADGALCGLFSGEFLVHDDKTRQRAVHDRVGGATCPWLSLDEVADRDATPLKQAIARARLAVVRAPAGPSVDALLLRLRAAVLRLWQAGVQRIVVTSVRGLLLPDPDAVPLRAEGLRVAEGRRHALTDRPVGGPELTSIPADELGYEGVESWLVLPRSTAPLSAGSGAVWGGGSLQERVVPVLTALRRAGAGPDALRYAIRIEGIEQIAGMYRLSARLVPIEQGALPLRDPRGVELTLRSDAPGVRVLPCFARGAQLDGDSVRVEPGAPFELSFRLRGASAAVRLVLLHPFGLTTVEPGTLGPLSVGG